MKWKINTFVTGSLFQEAIKAKSFLGPPKRISRGNVEAGFAQSDVVLEGELCTKGQKHIYLETLGALSVPRERDQIEVHTGSQVSHTLQVKCCLYVDFHFSSMLHLPIFVFFQKV